MTTVNARQAMAHLEALAASPQAAHRLLSLLSALPFTLWQPDMALLQRLSTLLIDSALTFVQPHEPSPAGGGGTAALLSPATKAEPAPLQLGVNTAETAALLPLTSSHLALALSPPPPGAALASATDVGGTMGEAAAAHLRQTRLMRQIGVAVFENLAWATADTPTRERALLLLLACRSHIAPSKWWVPHLRVVIPASPYPATHSPTGPLCHRRDCTGGTCS